MRVCVVAIGVWLALAAAAPDSFQEDDEVTLSPELVIQMATQALDELPEHAPERAMWIERLVKARCETEWRADAELVAMANESFDLRQADPDSLTWVASLANLGRCHMLNNEYAAASAALERTLGLARVAQVPPLRLAGHLRRSAHVARILGDLPLAGERFAEAISILESTRRPDPAALSLTLTQRARYYERQREPELAIADAERAVKVAERADAAAQGLAHQSLAYHQGRAGNLDAALTSFQAALPLLETAYGPEHLAVASLLNRFSDHLASRGDMVGARELLERNLAIVQAQLPPEHLWVTISLNNLAEMEYNDGDFVASRKLHESVLATRIATLGDSHPRVATSVGNLASTYRETKDYELAEQHYRRALAIKTEVYGEDHYEVAYTLDNLGGLLHQMGRLEEAEASFARAIELLPFEEDEPDLAFTLAAYGELLLDLDRWEEAESSIQRSLALVRKHAGDWHPRVPENLQNLGRLSLMRGDVATAAQYLTEAVQIFATTRGPRHFETGDGTLDLARAAWAREDVGEALRLSLLAESIGRDHLRLLSRGSTERNALRFAAQRRSGLDIAIPAALVEGDEASIARAWDEVIRSRALVFDELARRRWVQRSDSDAQWLTAAEELRRTRTQLASLTVRGAGDLDDEAYEQLLQSAVQRRDRAEEAMADLSLRFRQARDIDAVGHAEVTAGLPAGAALVAFARAAVDRQDHYVAFVQTVSQQTQMLDLGPADPIDDIVRDWRAEIENGAALSGPFARNAEDRLRDVGSRLRELVYDPIAPALASAELILVLPEGSLHHVNFAALPTDDGYLVDGDAAFHILSTERDLVRVSQESGVGLLALGGPAFDQDPDATAASHRGVRFTGCDAVSELEFAPLPAARAEVEAIAEMWRQASSSPAQPYVDGQASETRFKREAPGRQVVHLATHGYSLSGACADEASGRDRLRARDPIPTQVHSPLLLSGLALAAANRRAEVAPPQEDGILSGEEIVDLDLSGVDWVVLSACDTGVGEALVGEGLLGLRRSFLLAGARTLITSLWPVDDQATRDWMIALYRARLEEGLSTAQAIRAASVRSLAALRERGESTHPYRWAAFVGSGDWQ